MVLPKNLKSSAIYLIQIYITGVLLASNEIFCDLIAGSLAQAHIN